MNNEKTRSEIPLWDVSKGIQNITEQLNDLHKAYGSRFYGPERGPEPSIEDVIDMTHNVRELTQVVHALVRSMGLHITHFQEFDPDTSTRSEHERLLRAELHTEYSTNMLWQCAEKLGDVCWQMIGVQQERHRIIANLPEERK